MIAFAGSLPVSSVNVGLQASLGALQLEIEKLTLDLAGLVPAVAAKLEIGLSFPPVEIQYAAALAAHLNLAEITAQLNPTTWVSASVDASAGLAIQLGLVEARLQALLAITAPLEVGLAVGALSGWSYSGTARGFGTALRTASAGGWGSTLPTSEIAATLIATENPASWSAFGESFNTGSSADGLHYLGELGGYQWSTGLGDLMARLRLFLGQLRGMKATIEAQIQVGLGLNLPDPQAQLDVGLTLNLGVMLENMVTIRADLDLAIGAIQARIDIVVGLLASLSAQLSAGGLAVWTYSGVASELGAEFQDEIWDGIPDGNGATATVYGLVIASTPANMNGFSNIFVA